MTGGIVRAVSPALRDIEHALTGSEALLERSASAAEVWVAASVVEANAIVLGRSQRAGRVVDLEACARAGVRVLRRVTSGTAASIAGRAIHCTLALPHVAALFADATPPTILNRNVRPFLRGFARAGLVAQYFGRESIAVRQRPAALLGFEATANGAIVIELLVALDAPLSVPVALASAEERALDRWLGKEPIALVELMPTGRSALDLASFLIDAVAATSCEDDLPGDAPSRSPVVLRPDDPAPEGLVFAAPRRVPIGWLDLATGPSQKWLGGDILAPRYALDAVAAGTSIDAASTPILGATLADLSF